MIEKYLKLKRELTEIQILQNIYPSLKVRKEIIIKEINDILEKSNRDELIILIKKGLDI